MLCPGLADDTLPRQAYGRMVGSHPVTRAEARARAASIRLPSTALNFAVVKTAAERAVGRQFEHHRLRVRLGRVGRQVN